MCGMGIVPVNIQAQCVGTSLVAAWIASYLLDSIVRN